MVAEIDQLLAMLSTEISRPEALTTAINSAEEQSGLIEFELHFSSLTKLKRSDYEILLREARSLLTADQFPQYVSVAPKTAAALKLTMEGTAGRVLEGSGERSDLPRRAKAEAKKEVKRHVWGSIVGTVMALSNVMLALPAYGMGPTVSLGSMAIGVTALGVNIKSFPKILPKGVGSAKSRTTRLKRAG